jgi:hypothetical protein
MMNADWRNWTKELYLQPHEGSLATHAARTSTRRCVYPSAASSFAQKYFNHKRAQKAQKDAVILLP